MKHTFVSSISDGFLFGLNCSMNMAKFVGTNADFCIAYDSDITQEQRDAYNDAFPFKVRWFSIQELWNSLTITAKHQPSRFWTTPWILASKLLDEYDSICILQGDEFLMANVNSFFRTAALTDIVIAAEYHTYVEFEDLPFEPKENILDRVGYALYDQLVFCGRENKQILIDTYQQQCVDSPIPRNDVLYQDPLTALNQACANHLNKDRVIGLDGQTWTWDYGGWSRRKLVYDRARHRVYDNDLRLHGWHSKWWFEGIVTAAINRERAAGNEETAQIIAHNYNTEREVMEHFNNMTPATRNNNYTKEIWR
jgi:hypothetical protein